MLAIFVDHVCCIDGCYADGANLCVHSQSTDKQDSEENDEGAQESSPSVLMMTQADTLP